MKTLIGLGSLVVLLVTAIMPSASTFPPYSNPSRFFRRLSMAKCLIPNLQATQMQSNTVISYVCSTQVL
jgi:hypothetical protein